MIAVVRDTGAKALELVPTLRMDGNGRRSFLIENGDLIVDCAPPGAAA
jgi:hypothetical protein